MANWKEADCGIKYRVGGGGRGRWYFVIQCPDGKVLDSREGGEFWYTPPKWGKPKRVHLDYYYTRRRAESVMYKALSAMESEYCDAHDEVSRRELAGGGFVRVIRPKWRERFESLTAAEAAAAAAAETADRLFGQPHWNPRATLAGLPV